MSFKHIFLQYVNHVIFFRNNKVNFKVKMSDRTGFNEELQIVTNNEFTKDFISKQTKLVHVYPK